MSGGVDSSVVAALLKKRGYDVVGVTMQIWQESQTDPRHAGCCSLGAVEDARRVARILDIPHYIINYKDTFRKNVIDNFIEEYSAGRTPNPCVQCNKKVKFESLIAKMHEMGCDKLATGHYARVRRNKETGQYRLLRSRGGKDQSYVLYMLGQEQLSRVMFPLGELDSKAETRAMATAYNLPVAHKPDSQEICFVNEAGGYAEFLRKEKPELLREGELVHANGEKLGDHEGIHTFTVGQRKGIGLTHRSGRPLYVLKIEPATNRVVVGHDEDLLQTDAFIKDLYLNYDDEIGPIDVMAKIRYNMKPEKATLHLGDSPKLVFKEAIRAVSPGQMAVAYRGATVIGGGVIWDPTTQTL